MTSPASQQPREGPVTWEQFVSLPDDDRRELIDGFLVETEMPTALHEHIVILLGHFLTQWIRASKRGGVILGSGYKVRVNPRRGVMPDLQYFSRGNRVDPVALESGRPDLAVEVISPGSGRYDRVQKLAWYRSIGVPEYWIVDPEERSLHRFVLVDGEWRLPEVASDDALFRPSSFEGLEIPLAELWTLEPDTQG